jgi:geranylgeranyl reductase family protein
MRNDYDVIVVGAGPAGVATALYANRHGLRVLLIDKQRFPRDKICGDAVARKSLGYLRDLGLLEAVRATTHEPIDTAILGAPSGAQIRFDLNPKRDPHTPYLICRRENFDDVLIRAARQNVTVLEGWRIDDVLMESGKGVCGVCAKSDDGTVREYKARAVVGADGYSSVVARKLGVYEHNRHQWIVATRQYFRDLDIPANTVQLHYLDETLPGYFWLFPTGNGTVNVGLGSVHGSIKRRGGLRAIHERAVAAPRFRDIFAKAVPTSGIHGWQLPTPDTTRTICGDGFLLVGDAAGTVDPFTGEGIGNALCSGDVAARVIATALQEGQRVDLSSYADLLWKTLDTSELSLHYKLRSLARHRWLINFIVGRAAAHPAIMAWLDAIASESDGTKCKRSLTSPLTYLRLLLASAPRH